MIDRAVMAHLWTSLRVAVQRLRISRARKKGNLRIRNFETRRKGVVSRWVRSSPSSSRSCSTLRKELNEVLLVRYRRASSSSTSRSSASFKALSKSGSDVGLLSSGSGEDDENNLNGKLSENDSDADESVPLFPLGRKQMNRSSSCSFLPKAESMERKLSAYDLSSLDLSTTDWEKKILVNSISMRPAFRPGDPDISSRSHFRHYRLDNRDWRLSYRSPQLMQPVRWRLSTLSGLLRTLSDRYARRTGKLTPLHDKRKKQPLAKCFSSSSWVRPSDDSSTSANSARAADLALRRYDNPYQEFLRRAMEERNTKITRVRPVTF